MKIENTQAINPPDYDVIEAHFACKVSEEIRHFLENYNGQIINPEEGLEITFVSDESKSISESFPTIYHTADVVSQLDFISYIEDFLDESKWDDNDVEADKLLPLMSINGGSINLYVALCGSHEGKLYVVDNGDYGVCKVDMMLNDLILKISS